jgi:hypothetical protein
MVYLNHNNDPSDARYIAFLSRLADPLCEVLLPGARGIDFGCGPAPALAQIFTSRGCPTVAYDPLFAADTSLLQQHYDFVAASEVAEHAHDPRAFLDTLASMVRPGGTIGIMTRFHGEEATFERWWYRRDPTHVSFHSRRTMRWIARDRGWSLRIPAPNVSIFTTGAAA